MKSRRKIAPLGKTPGKGAKESTGNPEFEVDMLCGLINKPFGPTSPAKIGTGVASEVLENGGGEILTEIRKSI